MDSRSKRRLSHPLAHWRLGVCVREHRDTADPTVIRAMLKVSEGAGGGYWWVQCGAAESVEVTTNLLPLSPRQPVRGLQAAEGSEGIPQYLRRPGRWMDRAEGLLPVKCGTQWRRRS